MKSKEEIKKQLDALDLPHASKEEFLRILTTGSVRQVYGTNSVRGIFRSEKMDEDIATESRTLEWAFAKWCEGNPDIIFYKAQPHTFHLLSDKKTPTTYTPDFFIVSKQLGGVFVETKHDKALRKIADPSAPKSQPWRFQFDENTTAWRSAAYEEACSEIGAKFRVETDKTIPRNLIRNYEFLENYVNSPCEVDEATTTKIHDFLKKYPGTRYGTLVKAFEEIDADKINFLLAYQKIYADLELFAISDGFDIPVFAEKRDAITQAEILKCNHRWIAAFNADPGARFKRGDTEITLVKKDRFNWHVVDQNGSTSLISEDDLIAGFKTGEITSTNDEKIITMSQQGAKILSAATPEHLDFAGKCFELIRHLVAAISSEKIRKTRTQQRYLKRWREAESTYGSGLVGLLPKNRPGNRNAKIDQRVEKVISEALEEFYLKKDPVSLEALWGTIGKRCDEHVPPLPNPSRQTIRARILLHSKFEILKKQFGLRAARKHEPHRPISIDEFCKRLGEHPWSVLHADHTQLDTEILSKLGFNLGRPWLSILYSPGHNRVMAYYLTFEPPSFKSIMGLMIDLAERHKRFPDVIITDNGKDFTSTYMRTILSHYKVGQQFRPPDQPRFGSSLERFLKTLTTRVIHNLPGQTRLTKEVRKVVSSHDPKHLAELRIGDLDTILQKLFFDHHDRTPSTITGISPRDSFRNGLESCGERKHLTIIPSRDFRISLLPTTRTGRATIQDGGITIDRISYWSEIFRHHKGEKVPIKYDPFDITTAFAQIGGIWYECNSLLYKEKLQNYSVKERRIVSDYIRSNGKHHERLRLVAAKEIAATLMTETIPALDLAKSKRDEEPDRTINKVVPQKVTPPKAASVFSGPYDLNDYRRNRNHVSPKVTISVSPRK